MSVWISLCLCARACSLSLIADCSVTCVLLLCYKSIVFASSTIFCIFPRLAHNTATLFVHSTLSIYIIYRVYTLYSYVLLIWLHLDKAKQETSFTEYSRKTKNKNKPKVAKEMFVAFFLHLCKSPDSCTGVCACVGVSLCVRVCMSVSVWLCEFCFPSATTSSDNDNACTAIRDLLQLTLCFLSTKTHLFTYYYYFSFLARFSARQRQHTSFLFVYIYKLYVFKFVCACE